MLLAQVRGREGSEQEQVQGERWGTGKVQVAIQVFRNKVSKLRTWFETGILVNVRSLNLSWLQLLKLFVQVSEGQKERQIKVSR